MNVWALAKDSGIRIALLRLSEHTDLRRLSVEANEIGNRQAIHISDRNTVGLTAYLYTYSQPQGRYGLQLHFPHAESDTSPYGAMESLELQQVIELLNLHFNSP